MIHNNSSDPVLIKKIHLQIWTLRDEIENIIEHSLTNNPEEVKKTISALRNELSGTPSEEGPLPDNVIGMPGVGGGDEEEEMSADEALGEFLDAEDDDDSADLAESETPDSEETPAPEAEQALEASAEGEADSETEPQAADAPQIEEDTPFEETGSPLETGNLSAYLPEANETGDAVFQRRPNLPLNQKLRAMCFLSEINMDAFYFFCDRNMTAGQSIVIDFLVPQRFLVMAEVVFCRPYNMRSRIISQTPLMYRCAARPLFIKPGERTLLREFLETIEPDIEALAAQQKAKKPIKKKEEEEDLDDLDDLDL